MATESSLESCSHFDEVSLAKLDIYARYLEEWLRTPLSSRGRINKVSIYDLCCGSGFAGEGNEGSALRAAHVLRDRAEQIAQHSEVDIRLVFNDVDPANVRQLAGRLGPMLQKDNGLDLARIQYFSQPFADALESILPELSQSKSANLIFIDRFGEQPFNEARLNQLRCQQHTDLLISIPSAWFRRFTESETAEFWAIDKSDIESVNYNHIHRFMTSYFRILIGNEHLVAPFTLKRGSDVSGLIFASRNPWRLDKFLKIAWRGDPFSGDTNFDLYEEAPARMQHALLDAHKVFDFQKELMACLESGKFDTDRDIYLYGLQRGFLGRHATETVKAYCGRRNVRFQTRAGKPANPRLSYTSFRRPRPILD